MEENNRYLPLELLFTLFLLESAALLFGDLLLPYRTYFPLGLAAGFSFSWFYRNKQPFFIRPAVNAGLLGIFAWIVYSIINSSFLYREIIAIFIKGLIVMEVVLSFNGSRGGFITYIQCLSLPLFMCFPVFAKDYNEWQAALSLAYIICWLAVLRIKFYGLLKSRHGEKGRSASRILIPAAVFLVIIFASWFFYNSITPAKIRKGGVLFEERMESQTKDETLEKEYYSLQDDIQKEVTESITGLTFREDRQETLMMLSSLIKESPAVAEVERARLGLISRLKTPGPGLEKGEEEDTAITIEDYIDKKVQLNLNRIREEIMNNLKKSGFSLLEMLHLSDLINKVENAGTNRQIKKDTRDLKSGINNSSASGEAKRDLRNLSDKLKEWKTYDAYRDYAASLDKESGTLEGRLKDGLKELLSDIDDAQTPSQLKGAEEEAGKLEKDAPPSGKETVNKAREMLELKSEMLLSERAAGLKEEIDNLKLSAEEREGLKEEADGIRDARDHRELSQNLSAFRDRLQENRMGTPENTEGLLQIKTHLLFNAKKEEVGKELEKSKLPDKGREFMEKLEKLEEGDSVRKVAADAEKLKKDLKEFSDRGFISKESSEKLTQDMEEIKEILLSGMRTEDRPRQAEREAEERKADYQERLEDLIEDSSLNEEKKESLKQLAQALNRAESISQIDNIKEAADEELKELSADKTKEREIKMVREAFESSIEIKRVFMTEKALSAIGKKAEDLREFDSQASEMVRTGLEKIRESRSEEQLKSRVDILKDEVDLHLETERPEVKRKSGTDIYILPVHPVIPLGSSVPLRAIAVFDKTFIKELGAQAQWSSSEPYIAWVDETGVIHTSAKGKTHIYVKYAGQESEKIEVAVVDRIDEQVMSAVEKEAR